MNSNPAAPSAAASGRRKIPVIGAGLAVAGSIAVAVGAGLPWLRIGRVDRSAFALARSARSLGLVESAPARAGVVLLFCTPLLIGVLLLTWSLGLRRTLLVTTLSLAALAIAVPILVVTVSRAWRLGPITTLVGGACCLAAALSILFSRRRSSG